MLRRRFVFYRLARLLAVIAAALLQGCGSTPPAITPTPGPTEEGDGTAPAVRDPTSTGPPQPLEIGVHLGVEPNSLDPAFVGSNDASGNDLAANLFVGLAWLNPDTGLIEPALAESWERSPDGLTWTIYLRDDIFWVRWNPETGEAERVRAVTAADVVYATRRACLSETHALLAATLFVIQGCRDVYSVDPTRQDSDALADAMGVRVLNEVAVEFKLAADSATFLTLLSMPILRPLPQEIVDAAGAEWATSTQLVTSGPFLLDPASEVEEGRYTLIANPFWPLERQGNVDRVQVAVGRDYEDAFASWEAGDLAAAPISPSAVGAIPFGEAPAYSLMGKPWTTLLVPAYDTPPMNNPDVRRALALAIDRQALINTVLEPAGGTGLPAGGMVPPGTAAAERYDPSSTLYNPAAARAALAAAGYSGCSGFPQITLLLEPSELSRELAERLVEMWAAALGCEGKFEIEQLPLLDVEAYLQNSPDALQRQFRGPRPGLVLLHWQGDYPDPHHWLADVLGCRETFPSAYLNSLRPCVEADQWLVEASQQHGPEARAEAYTVIQEALFGPEGEMPVIPLYFETRAMAFQPWVEVFPTRAGPLRFDQWLVNVGQQP